MPAEWHGWLHYTFDEPPTTDPLTRRAWERDHIPNLDRRSWPGGPRARSPAAASARQPAAITRPGGPNDRPRLEGAGAWARRSPSLAAVAAVAQPSANQTGSSGEPAFAPPPPETLPGVPVISGRRRRATPPAAANVVTSGPPVAEPRGGARRHQRRAGQGGSRRQAAATAAPAAEAGAQPRRDRPGAGQGDGRDDALRRPGRKADPLQEPGVRGEGL